MCTHTHQRYAPSFYHRLIIFITVIFCPNTYPDSRGVLWEMCRRPQYVDVVSRATFAEYI